MKMGSFYCNIRTRNVYLNLCDAVALEQLFSASAFLRFTPASHHSSIDPCPAVTLR